MVIAIDQSTSATKAILFNDRLGVENRVNIPHAQFYPVAGWVEHDAEEIYRNTVAAIRRLRAESGLKSVSSLALTNQRETVVVWDKKTGKPVSHAIVWQCQRGSDICEELRQQGFSDTVRSKTGLLIDPYFSASGIKWILDNVEGAREAAEQDRLLAGTVDSWLIWKLTAGKVHATDYTNASRTLLFNIHTLDWDDQLLELFTVPRSMMPEPLPCDTVFGETDVEGLFDFPIPIAGVMGDSHGALAGQMCFESGYGKATYGTGSSVMVNIGQTAPIAPEGLVTSVGFAALGKIHYAFEGNIHCTGATLKWMCDELKLIGDSAESESLATSVADNGGVYLVPAFAGLGAPWWRPEAKAMICGMTLGTNKGHVVRAALEAIAYQIKDLVDLMTEETDLTVLELRVDGGPTKNTFLMQFQADMLGSRINRSPVEEASALGAVIMNGLARGQWTTLEEVAKLRESNMFTDPTMTNEIREKLYEGWVRAVRMITHTE